MGHCAAEKNIIGEKYGKEHAHKLIELFENAFPNNKLIDLLAFDYEMLRKVS